MDQWNPRICIKSQACFRITDWPLQSYALYGVTKTISLEISSPPRYLCVTTTMHAPWCWLSRTLCGVDKTNYKKFWRCLSTGWNWEPSKNFLRLEFNINDYYTLLQRLRHDSTVFDNSKNYMTMNMAEGYFNQLCIFEIRRSEDRQQPLGNYM